MNAEFLKKKEILDGYLAKNGFDGALFSLKANEAWLTCGGSCWVGKDSQSGSVDLAYIDGKYYLVAAENEKARTNDEELKGLGFETVSYPWYENKVKTIRELIGDKRVASDTGVAGTENRASEIVRLRYAMLPEEINRAEKLGRDCANAMYETCTEIKPGDSEHEISAVVTAKLMRNGIQAPCCLIATDERIARYRHPIPTFKKLEKQCLVVICGVRDGLVMSMSRMVSFGPISDDLNKRHMACANIAARFMEKTRVGVNAKDVFCEGINAYKEFGYADDWKLHHQGGPIGYDSRDYVCTFDTDEVIVDNQMFAWNPTVTGTKVEDTFLLSGEKRTVLTEMENWPLIEIGTSVGKLRLPGILVR